MQVAVATKSEDKKKAVKPRQSDPLPYGSPHYELAVSGLPFFLQPQIQRKLAVGAANDPLEREADAVAENITRNRPGPQIQRKCACGGAEEECSQCRMNQMIIQRRSRGNDTEVEAPPIVGKVLATSGMPLDHSVRRTMEPRFGHDFEQVRIHTDVEAAESAKSVKALAYAVGNHIVFGAGQYAPGSEAGEHLLAHELTHTVQQTGGTAAKVQRYSWDEFKGDVGSAAHTVAGGAEDVGHAVVSGAEDVGHAVVSGAEDIGHAVVSGAQVVGDAVVSGVQSGVHAVGEAADWLLTEAGQVLLQEANALASLFGGSVVVRGGCLLVTIPEMRIFPSFQKTLVETPEEGFFLPIWEAGGMVGPFPLAGAFGILGTAKASVEAAVGPGVVRGISLELCPFRSHYQATGQLYVAAALGPRLQLFGGLAAIAGTAIPMDPPIPIVMILQAGVRGTGTGWGIGGIQDTVTLDYTGGRFSFSNVTDFMAGVLLQGDVDLFAAARLYEKIICQYVYPLKHWETGRAWRLTIPIHAGIGGGASGTVGVGPITSGPMPISDIETVIHPLPSGWDCLEWEEIKQILCDNHVLPPSMCPPKSAVAPVTPPSVVPVTPPGPAIVPLANTCASPIDEEFEMDIFGKPLTKIRARDAKHTRMAKKSISQLETIAGTVDCTKLSVECEKEFCVAAGAKDTGYGGQIDNSSRGKGRYRSLLEEAFNTKKPPKSGKFQIAASDSSAVGYDIAAGKSGGTTKSYRVKGEMKSNGKNGEVHLFPEK